jgi:peptidoglycan/LPS O-acetylase OafA/YrhL
VTARTLGTTLDPRRNALNAVRLLLSVGVLFWHSFPLTGTADPVHSVRQLLSSISVDGFFAISGFLITASWIRQPRLLTYLQARILRILPAFWLCLLLTAAVLAPLSAVIEYGSLAGLSGRSAVNYVLSNGYLQIRQFGITGTLDSVPLRGVWNGSLWTLRWEFACYLGVAVLGLVKILERRGAIPALFLAAVGWLTLTTFRPTGNYYLDTGPRFAVMFLAGAVVFYARRFLPASWWMVIAALVAVAASSLLPDYRLVAALPLAYASITAGALCHSRRLQLHNDISYGMYVYAFPVQQMLAVMGLTRLGVVGFFMLATAATVPLAAGSWFFVERPALSLKKVLSPQSWRAWRSRSGLAGMPVPQPHAATQERAADVLVAVPESSHGVGGLPS